MPWKEFLLSALIPTAEQAGESKIAELLVKMKAQDPDHFEADLNLVNKFVKRMDVFSEQSKTPFDDMVTKTVLMGISDAAAQLGITLEDA